MDHYITGATIKQLREAAGLTQAELARQLNLSDKTISKWETARGLPDVTLLEPLANALKISVIELLSGRCVVNANRSCNMKRSRLFVCPICGNVIHAAGNAVISCCGVTLPPLEAEEPDEAHAVRVDRADGEYRVSLQHPMSKTHYISFIAYVTDSRFEVVKLFPEGDAEAWFFPRGRGELYWLCNQHGLMKITLDPRKL